MSANLEILQQWVGSPQHSEVIIHLRGELIKAVVTLLLLPTYDSGIPVAHARVKLRLELLVDLRLHTIDAQVLSKDAVSQFESQLPGRIDYVDQLRKTGENSI